MKLKIFEFSDYRLFLKAFLAEKAKSQRGYTASAFARNLKLKDPSSLTKVLNGQRHPGEAMIREICRFFGFSLKEETYFRDLVALRKEKGATENGTRIAMRLKSINPKIDFEMVSYDNFALLTNWYCLAIKEMIQLRDFRNDPYWIQKRLGFNITMSEIRDAIDVLLRLKLIEQVGKTYRLSKNVKNIETPKGVASVAVQTYHKNVLSLASEAVDRLPAPSRHNIGSTVTTTKRKMQKAKEMLDEFHDELLNFLQTDSGDEVFQFSAQIFPLTKTISGKDNR